MRPDMDSELARTWGSSERLAGQPDRTAGADRQVVAGGQGRGQGIEFRDVTGTQLVLQAVPGAAEGAPAESSQLYLPSARPPGIRA